MSVEWTIGLSVGGIVLGWALGFFTQWWRDHHGEKKENVKVRLMIMAEIHYNIKKVFKFSKKTVYAPMDEFVGGQIGLLRMVPFPECGHSCLDSQLPRVPNVLSASEIERILAFYDDLRNIHILHSEFAGLAPTDSRHKKEGLVDEIKEKLTQWIETGNPLESHA